MGDLKHLTLHDLWAECGATFAPFAGWQMPVTFDGVMAEHLWAREQAGLFDVSHMGQIAAGSDPQALEAMIPSNIDGLAVGRQRYGMFTNEAGGVLDDLMIANTGGDYLLVVNASRFDADLAHLQTHLPEVTPLSTRGLLALQGPQAEAALARIIPAVAEMRFLDWRSLDWNGTDVWVSRSGYTGEDGFEISVPLADIEAVARALLADDRVKPIGLGARDSLRLEAGLPLYGQDMTESTSPVEAGQAWAVGKARRAGGFPGAPVILQHLTHGAPRRRTGLLPEGRAPMRAGVPLFDASDAATPVGVITSGGYSPSLGKPIAMALVTADVDPQKTLFGEVRGKRLPARQTDLPFVPHRYKR